MKTTIIKLLLVMVLFCPASGRSASAQSSRVGLYNRTQDVSPVKETVSAGLYSKVSVDTQEPGEDPVGDDGSLRAGDDMGGGDYNKVAPVGDHFLLLFLYILLYTVLRRFLSIMNRKSF